MKEEIREIKMKMDKMEREKRRNSIVLQGIEIKTEKNREASRRCSKLYEKQNRCRKTINKCATN